MDGLEKIKYGILFNYYGKLLNENQQEILNLYFNEDLGFSEIANMYKTTRQAIRQVIINAESRLDNFEKQLGIVERIKDYSKRLQEILNNEKLDTKVKEKLKGIIESIEDF
ncbi:MAG: hypothetical protein K5765_08065 [Clostridia bacterium]|nr:hypothetical protein [Clostridia bacterium]